MSDRLFIFRGYFRSGFPFGDTLRYLELSEDSSIEEAIVRAFSVFYYPKILKRLAVPQNMLDEAQDQSISYCWSAIADLDKLESTVNLLPAHRESKLRRRPPGSQYFFEVMINIDVYDQKFLSEALGVLGSGVMGEPRELIGQAISGLYHPLALNAFAEPLNQVVDAIHSSRSKFRGLLVDLGAKSVSDTAPILPVYQEVDSSLEVSKKRSIVDWS